MQMVKIEISDHARLVNCPVHVREQFEQALTLANPKFEADHRRCGWSREPAHLTFYWWDQDSGFCFPRGYARQALEKLRKAGVQPEIVDRTLSLEALHMEFRGQLRPYQRRAVEAILARRYGSACLPTGSGKTVLALDVIAKRKQPALILVHSLELLNQWADRIKQFLGIEAGRIGAGQFDITSVTVGVINSVRGRLDELQGKFGHVVVDECHRCPSAMFSEVVSSLDAMYLLGLSATPYRADRLTRLIFLYLGDQVIKITKEELERSGAICKPEIIMRPTSFWFHRPDKYAQMISAMVLNQERNDLIVSDIAANTNGSGTALVVSSRVNHCETIAKMLEDKGLKVALLIGGMSVKKREQVVADVQAEKVQVLVSTSQLVAEGFDCSGLVDLYLATPVKFNGRMTQIIGRVLRPAEGKTARVFDYVDEEIDLLKYHAKQRWRA
ncbi:Superfamily II DNA or RNA helicase [Desulfonatronum zhilinae]|nr:Superfamily II DNA or RNA helicase [Desulfonatronum zhilinae]